MYRETAQGCFALDGALGHKAVMRTLPVLVSWLLATSAFGQVVERATTERRDAENFGKAIVSALNERDSQRAEPLIDMQGLGVRAARTVSESEQWQKQFASGVAQAGSSKFVAALLQNLEQTGGTVKFIKVTDTRPAGALVRLDLGDAGFDYFEFVVETKAGRARAVDWFQMSTGELMSTSMGSIGQMFTSNDPGLIGRVLGIERVDKASLDLVRKAGELQRAGKFAESLAALQKLPAAMANTRIMLNAQASMASLAKLDDEYTKVLAKLAERYPDRPETAFRLVDHYFVMKNLPKMLQSIDAMEKRIGTDGATRTLRAAAYYVSDDFASTLKYADDAIRIEPDYVSAHDTRATALVRLGRFPEAVAQFRHTAQRFEFGYTREMFAADPMYAKFMASPAFRAWLPE